ncbi:hypothetical protein GCM10010266_02850 [Streptomyces griseomycini]|nr:hypothetical protein GCM10010266_02850 [Streptomyces griseomycini]
MASRIALSRRLCVTYHSRGRPAGSGRFATGAQGVSSRTGRFAVDWVGRGFGLSAAAGTGILLSRSGRPAEAHDDSGTTLEHCLQFTARH